MVQFWSIRQKYKTIVHNITAMEKKNNQKFYLKSISNAAWNSNTIQMQSLSTFV